VSSPYHDDPLFQSLARLPAVLPNEACARQLRAQCRALLEHSPRQKPVTLEPAAVGCVCAMYAWQIVRIVIGQQPW
jgi:hypothetical protein